MPNNMLKLISMDSKEEMEYHLNFESYDEFIEIFTSHFGLGELIMCSYELIDGEVLDLGTVLYEANCYDDCAHCDDIEAGLCHRICVIYFIGEVNRRLESALDKKFWEDFWNGNATYRVC